MIPLSKLHGHIAVPLWYFSIFLFFMGAIYFTKEILIADNQKRALSSAFYFLGILATLRFLLSAVQRVQSDCLVLFFLSLFVYALYYRKDVLAGLSLATAAMVKLTPLIFLPYLILRKKFKAAAAFCCFVFSYLLLPSLLVGFNTNMEYLKNWLLVHQKNPPEYFIWYKNQSLLSCLGRFLTADSQISILKLDLSCVWPVFLVLAAVLFGAIFIFRKKPDAQNSGPCYLTEVSLVLICMILFSPLAWKHTFVHLIIPHLVLLYYVMYLHPQERATKVLLIASFFINTVLNPELTKPFARTIQLYSNITLGTLILYAALLRIGYKQCRR